MHSLACLLKSTLHGLVVPDNTLLTHTVSACTLLFTATYAGMNMKCSNVVQCHSVSDYARYEAK